MLLLFVAASISHYFFLLHPHITTRQFLFFFTLQIYLFFLFYTNYLGIVIFRFLCAWLSSSIGASRFTLLTLDVQFTSQVWSIYTNCRNVINAKTFFSQRKFQRAWFCIQREKLFLRDSLPFWWCNIFVSLDFIYPQDTDLNDNMYTILYYWLTTKILLYMRIALCTQSHSTMEKLIGISHSSDRFTTEFVFFLSLYHK